VVDPDSEAVLEEPRLEPLHRFVRAHLPALIDRPSFGETCLYAKTPDDDFVIDRLGPIVLGIGFGGHGFKFGALMGSLLADLVQGGTAPFPHRFGYARFQAAATR
jgi:sarcosine oxidase